MACINRCKLDKQAICGAPVVPPMNPRISFSSDFVVEQHAARTTSPPPDPDFEFAVGSHSMIDADRLFFEGRLLPLKDTHQRGPYQRVITTLREELRTDEEDGARWERPLKGSINWRVLFGIKKARRRSAAAVTAKKSDEVDDELLVKPT
ncbi:uncharacterized protein LOC135680366 [Musa acuminata AAA Group]|uniref:uncharacterized protein LOC135680366 n=1 Tax=Musa acuminata AAA Group TaxID=214697 RepID=UPI0031DFB170